MKLFSPCAAVLLSSILVVSVSGARKHHKNSQVGSSVASQPQATSIVEADATPSMSQQSMSIAQSRSAAINERSQAYSQPLYSTQYDPNMMTEPVMSESAYYDPMPATPHHHHHAHQQHAAASGAYHHHVPASGAHARHAGASAASSVAPYAAAAGAAPYGAQQGYAYGNYGYDYPARYVAQGSHYDPYVHRRAHGHGWHPDLEVQTLFFIGIPLIIIPLLFLWPYFLYSLHGRGGHYGGYGYRSGAEDAEVITPEQELKAKTDELTKKIVPKLSKKSDKSPKTSEKAPKTSDKTSKSSNKTTTEKSTKSTDKSSKS